MAVPKAMPESKSVLLIDDDPAQLRLREMILRQAGVIVHVATTAESALALLRSPSGEEIGLVVTDHIMPNTTGAEFVRQLREQKPHIPVAVISGLAEAEDEYEGLNVTFRQKPCPPDELIRIVTTTLKPAA